MNTQPAGWFPDPHDGSQLRYWDGRTWTEHRSPRHVSPSAAFGPRAPLPPPGPTGKWYFVITLASLGLLASVPFFHAASRLDRPQLRRIGVWLVIAGGLGWAAIALAPTDENGEPTGFLPSVGALIMLAVMLVACLQLLGLRREVYPSRTGNVVGPPSANQAAIAGVQEARQKRDEARRLALRDPMMARELGVGCPGSTQYDDGGLLDLNLASEDELTALCLLPRETAAAVVAARARLGKFLQVDDAIAFGQVGQDYVPLLRDRGIVILDT